MVHKCSGHVLQYVDDYLWHTIFLSNSNDKDVHSFEVIKSWHGDVGIIVFNGIECEVIESDTAPSLDVGTEEYKFLFELE